MKIIPNTVQRLYGAVVVMKIIFSLGDEIIFSWAVSFSLGLYWLASSSATFP